MANWIDAFQFLIGRLKTIVDLAELPHLLVFQFLIGRLKTKLAIVDVAGYRGFNSS